MLTFGPDGITGHPDHQTVSAWTAAAFDRAAPRGARLLHSADVRAAGGAVGRAHRQPGRLSPGLPILTPTDRLALDLVLGPDVAVRKVRALAAQTTQTAGLITTLGVDCYTAWVAEESFVEAALHPHGATRPVMRAVGAA